MSEERRAKPGPGQESVWDYPRPPAAVEVQRSIRVVFGGQTIAETSRPIKVMETSHPPVYYIPAEDVRVEYLSPSGHHTVCEYKGVASYWHVSVSGREVHNAGWSYENPSPGYEPLAHYIAFYPALMDECTVDGERVTPQPGRFYGGWITSEVVGPFKGEPGTLGW